MKDKKALRKRCSIGILLLIALLIPTIVRDNYIISVLVTCFLFASMGVAWNIIGGYGGKVSWCHSAFIALGAYTCFILYNRLGISPILAIPVGMLVCYIFATIMGAVTLKYRGPYFAITTMAFGELLRVALLYFNDLTNGSSGLLIAYSKPDPWNMLFGNDTPYYYISIALLIIVLLISHRFIHSKTGYYLRAIKGDEDAAESLGINSGRVKLHAFQLSAVVTSTIGTIYALFLTYIDPNVICSSDLAIKIGAIVVIGGIARLWGPVIGSFIVIPLTELMLVVFPEGGAQLFYGLALVVIVVLMPGGLISLMESIIRRISASHKGPGVKKQEGAI